MLNKKLIGILFCKKLTKKYENYPPDLFDSFSCRTVNCHKTLLNKTLSYALPPSDIRDGEMKCFDDEIKGENLSLTVKGIEFIIGSLKEGWIRSN